MLRHIALGLFCFAFIALSSVAASAQQIVSDPALDARLVAFEQDFPAFVAAHPELSTGAVGPAVLDGKRGKVGVSYSLEGMYQINYGALDFEPTSPISPDRFLMTLEIRSVAVVADASLCLPS